jgi:hypothetical protein
MASESAEDTVAQLEARVAKLERLAPHHRAHINALEALLLQVLPRAGVDDASLRLALSALLPDHPEAEQGAADRAAVLLDIHRASDA